MKTTFIATLGFLLLTQCQSSPKNSNHKLSQIQNNTSIHNAGNDSIGITNYLPQNLTASTNQIKSNSNNTSEDENAVGSKNDESLFAKNAIVIDLEEVYKMSIVEYARRRIRSLWDYLIHGSKEEPQSTFVGRCIGLAKKIRQLIPIVMIGGGIIITKLAFLVLFSLKTIGLLGLLLLLNVGTVAAKLGAHLASKKSDHSPQDLHVHVQPWKSDEHTYHSSHLKGPPYGWDDKSDDNIESHDLYNLYEKLKFENNLRRYISSNRRA